jgi:hypothetical protein
MKGGIASWAVAELVGKATLLTRVPAALSTPERKLGIWDVIPWPELGKAALAAVAGAAGIFLLRAGTMRAWVRLPEGFIWRVLPLAVAGMLFVIGYMVVLYATGIRPLRALAGMRSRGAA